MKKILLDFKITETPEQVQDYLALEFDFPDYYGRNLDALYDMLTELGEDTCVGIFETGEERRIDRYMARVKRVFKDAEQDNPHLCVIFGDLEENFEEEEEILL